MADNHPPPIIDAGDRRTGRTTRLLEWVLDDPNRVVLAPDERQASYLRDQLIYSYNLTPPEIRQRVLSLGQVRNNLHGGRQVLLAIDNLDTLDYPLPRVLQYAPVGYITIYGTPRSTT